MPEIYETGSGWLTPAGQAIACRRYGHLETIKHLPGAPDISDLMNLIDEAERDCQALEDAGEHPEWHNYEMALDDGIFQAHNRIYNTGFVRIGTNRYWHLIEFEGTKAALENLRIAISRETSDLKAALGDDMQVTLRERET